MPAPLIDVSGITLQRDSITILDNFSWTVEPGQNWIIFGPNGAGKTTLLNAIQGYMWPSEGKIAVFGGTLGDGVDVREMRREIAIVSEPVRNMIAAHLTGLEVLITGIRAHLNIFDDPTPDEINSAREVAAITRVEPLLAKVFSIMSTGERQRLLIARAVLASPQIVILDEPCSGLDLAGREWVLQTIESAAAWPGNPTLLLTTHHVEEVTREFTHALLIKEGKVFRQGPLAEVFTSAALTEMFDFPLTLGQQNHRWYARAT